MLDSLSESGFYSFVYCLCWVSYFYREFYIDWYLCCCLLNQTFRRLHVYLLKLLFFLTYSICLLNVSIELSLPRPLSSLFFELSLETLDFSLWLICFSISISRLYFRSFHLYLFLISASFWSTIFSSCNILFWSGSIRFNWLFWRTYKGKYKILKLTSLVFCSSDSSFLI